MVALSVTADRVMLLPSFRGNHLSPLHFHLPLSKHTMVLLVTSDNEQFVVEKDVAERSVLIKNMLEGDSFTPYLTPKTPQ